MINSLYRAEKKWEKNLDKSYVRDRVLNFTNEMEIIGLSLIFSQPVT